MRKTKTFRIDERLLDEVRKKGLDLNIIVEAAIARALKDKKCPYCNQKLKEKK